MIASGNAGKVKEFRRMLGELQIEVQGMDELGVEGAEEVHGTFVENAIAKARHVALETGKAALSDDSGICVSALSGRPGVRSARYSGEGDDGKNNDMLLSELEGEENRDAHYHCSLVLMRFAEDPAPLVSEARWNGKIAESPRGSGGFGYDPLFVLDDGRTAAEMEPEEKDSVSHRGVAMRAMLGLLDKELG